MKINEIYNFTIMGESSMLAKTQAAELVTKAMSATIAAQIRKLR